MTVNKINEWFEKIGRFQLKRRWWFLAVIIIISAAGFAGLSRLVLSYDEENWHATTQEQKQHKDLFKEMFGNQDIVAVFVEADDVFDPEVISAIERLSVRLETEVPFADKVISLTRVAVPIGDGLAMQSTNPFAEGIPGEGKELSQMTEEEREQLEEKKALIMNRSSLVNNLISDDTTETWVILSLKSFSENDKYEVGKAAISIVESDEFKSSKYTFKGSGTPYTEAEQQDFIIKETAVRIIVGFLVMIICLTIFVRSLRGVVVPILATIGGIGSVLGFSSWFGIPAELNLITVPILLGMALSVGYAIHYINSFQSEFRNSSNRKEAVVQAVKAVGWSILFTVITTMASFVSFIGVGIGALKWVGATSSLIVFTVYVYVIVLLPILYSFGKDKLLAETTATRERERKRKALFKKIGELYAGFGKSVIKHRIFVIIIGAFVSLVSIFGLFKITVNMDYVSMMGKRVPYVARIITIMNAKLGNQHSYDVMIEYPDEGAFKNPAVMQALEDCGTELGKLRLTKISGDKPRVTSVTSIIKEINRSLNGDDPEYYKLPDDEAYLAWLLYMYEYSGGEELFAWVSEDYSTAHIHVEMKEYNANEVDADIADANRLAKKYFPGATTSCIGEVIDFASMNHTLVIGELKSFGGSFAIILLILILAFASIRTGLISMIPNVAPVLLVGGLMGFLNFPLDMLTMTIMPMILGIAVDDTIHFTNHLKYEFELTRDYYKAVINSFAKIGRSMLATTVILCTMFTVYMFSPITMMFRIGSLSAIGLLAALISDYTLTPILLYMTKPFGEEIINKNVAHKTANDMFRKYLYLDEELADNAESYIFVRLYNPEYSFPLYYANALKWIVEMTEVSAFNASHAGIGFSLDDTFYGLTLMSKPNLYIEQCVDTMTNEYMKQCNSKKSIQMTYAMRVTGKERNTVKDMLLKCQKVQYSNMQNLKLWRLVRRRKFFTKKANREFVTFYRTKKDISIVNKKISAAKRKKFNCSGFIAYVLYNSVKSVREFFDKHHIDFRYLTVTDLASIPGMTPLFSSAWVGFNDAAKQFVKACPLFQKYISAAPSL